MGAHNDKSVLRRYRFGDDGVTLERPGQGQYVDVPDDMQTPMLTVWRTLWMELDDMVAPDPVQDGPFDGAGVGNDDVESDPALPPLDLAESSMPSALIEVKPLPAEYNEKDATQGDDTGTVEFVHNMTAQVSSRYSDPVRDEASEADFWVIHTIGAYEERTETPADPPPYGGDWDPNGEPWSWFGWAYQYGADGANFIFNETIRDWRANDPDATRDPADEDTLINRTVLHEALHRFLGPHPTNPNDRNARKQGMLEGIMLYDVVSYGNDQANQLTHHQIRLIQSRNYPR